MSQPLSFSLQPIVYPLKAYFLNFEVNDYSAYSIQLLGRVWVDGLCIVTPLFYVKSVENNGNYSHNPKPLYVD